MTPFVMLKWVCENFLKVQLMFLTAVHELEEVKSLAVELQDMLRAKVGVTSFANIYSRIRQNALTVRQDRKTARVTQVSNANANLYCATSDA